MSAVVILPFLMAALLIGLIIILVIFNIKSNSTSTETDEVEFQQITPVQNYDTSSVSQADLDDEISSYKVVTTIPDIPSTDDSDNEDPILKMIKADNYAALKNLAEGAIDPPKIYELLLKSRNFYKNKIKNSAVIKTASNILEKINKTSKIGTLINRMGMRASTKAMTKVAEKTAIEGLENAAMKAPLKYLNAAWFAYELISGTLDQTLGAYGATMSRDDFVSLKNSYLEQCRDDLIANGESWPVITGPLDKLNGNQISQLQKDVTAYIDSDINMAQAYANTIIAKIVQMKGQNKTTDEIIDEVNEMNIEHYLKSSKAHEFYKSKYGGKIVNLKNKLYLTYTTKQECDTSYNWPLNPGQNYSWWEPTDGYSYVAPYMWRKHVENFGQGVYFDNNDYMIYFTDEYCRGNATESDGRGSCTVNEAQNFFENVFGMTVVRGLIQVFDPKQYQSCPEGSDDGGLVCVSRELDTQSRSVVEPDCKNNGGGWFTSSAGICAKCPDDFPYPKGATCYNNKNAAASGNLGAVLAPTNSCPPQGYPDFTVRTSTADPYCYHKDTKKDKAGQYILTVPVSTSCPSGYSQCLGPGGLCYKQPPCCVRGGVHSDLIAHPECAAWRAKPYNKSCPSGYSRRLSTDLFCEADKHNAGKNCSSGYDLNNDGNACVKSVPIEIGMSKAISAMGPGVCPSDHPTLIASLCYKACPAGYHEDPTHTLCVNDKAFGMEWKKRKIPYAKPDFGNSPMGRMAEKFKNCNGAACKVNAAMFMAMAINPIVTGNGLGDIVTLGFDLQTAYQERMP